MISFEEISRAIEILAQDAPAIDGTDLAAALAIAVERDRLGYLNGVKGVQEKPDKDQWNAFYEPDSDTITIEGKLTSKSFDEQVHVLLHESGHRGQEVDKPTFQKFKKLGLGNREEFVEMANATHLADYKRKGRVDGMHAEAFAESYARWCLDMPMPDEVRAFWDARSNQRPS